MSSPTVTLTAAGHDAPVRSTYYAIDDGQAQLYVWRSVLDGTHTVWFWSTDTDGNTETMHSIAVKVDEITPDDVTDHFDDFERLVRVAP